MRPTGHIRERRPGSWEVRYISVDVAGQRRVETATVRGTRADAVKELRKRLRDLDTGAHISSEKITVSDWCEHWLSIGAPGRKGREVSARSHERYQQIIRRHIVPTLGTRQLQQLQAAEIDALYARLREKMSERTLLAVHNTFGAALGTAVRTGKLISNPLEKLAKTPFPKEEDHGMVLEAEQLRHLIRGLQGSANYAIVVTAALTGARRNEILALRWEDLDIANKTLRIERAVEDTDKYGLRIKGPKTERSKRIITIDDTLLEVLLAERERHLRFVAGVPDGAVADLRLVRLPAGALMFPNLGSRGSLTALRAPGRITWWFKKEATALGFPQLRFHDLRGTHITLLLDAGEPAHAVAQRCGHSAAVMLRSYAKRTRRADASVAAAVGALARGIMR